MFNFKDLELPKYELARNFGLADYQYEIILEKIKNFESNLNDDQEVALKLTNFGQNILMNVNEIGYSNPSLIHYYGFVNNVYSELTQHISQISFLLTSVTKTDPLKPARRIGFKLQDD